MEDIKIFISYHKTADGTIASLLKQHLETYFGFKLFLAHDDLPPSVEWEEEIQRKIKDCDFFIPLLSEAFKTSEFTDQETGMACAWNKKIIPIKLGETNPYGFIRKYQALKFHTNINIEKEILRLASLIFLLPVEDIRFKKYRETAINSLITCLANSKSFRTTNIIIKSLLRITSFNEKQLFEIAKAVKVNAKIHNEKNIFPFLKTFLQNTYGINIDI